MGRLPNPEGDRLGDFIEGKWLARCKDQTSNPLSLAAAKSQAMAMAKGAPGDYRITRPINHLNALAARLIDAA